MNLEQQYIKVMSLLRHSASRLARKYRCNHLIEDIISAGTVAFLEHFNEYDESIGASFSTFIRPYIVGAQKREIERMSTAYYLSRSEFKVASLFPAVQSLDEEINDDGLTLADVTAIEQSTVEEIVLDQIHVEILQKAFDELSYKEREIVGGCFGVFGYGKQLLADVGEQFNMKESAVAKARDKAVVKLEALCRDAGLVVARGSKWVAWNRIRQELTF